MSVLVFADSTEGKFKKSAFEVVSYGKKVAEQLGSNVIALAINANNNEELFAYGAEKVVSVSNDSLATFNAKAYASVIKQVADAQGSSVVILDSSIDGLFVAPMIAVALDAGYASNVVALPSATHPFTVKRKAFSNKAFSNTVISSEKKVIGVAKNSYGIHENLVSGIVENFEASVSDTDLGVTSEKVERITGQVTIADADTVVSAGRGLKGPENWGMIEELADILGAATACSKPVSDLGWRPHGEHVGQTGKPVASNLYIAIGISGAIQHLAGINASKVKVVINTDPEAPFFKAADYGIVGDAFEVVPKLIEKLKAFKQA
ncbi:electron transfer flavoprotein alpha subunit apoprotein [Polaribacter sp. Hel1_33_78]|jgi:electron transfer flavoprotein alpha subunit|uniref:electron transfer flavoprotein subunit alpha/FixB family protein n=1 Tax=unclassified Polaribacter TaxID=196858 RepID=UPI00052D69B5|nr:MULTISPECIES: electron transfer flavoprotein subunit alpha/FixB family protein [unclassified Polaribacter]KGL59589.1 electron transfer flavoprotein subunit alpha [Polaribacter sp. Hel1_33_49]MDG1403433.1 electron transfer flavoprotein subunit alpha/FixB family protein [Polaribacter sp.]PKV64084.1 electron transfer flavoprotein alpha subunit apoprotein [Polaribacter sp. Hel1_33_96]SDU20040.1 electron transfer flavoprotein alpha subunit apoprotein [Polaribacter sp. Hel1_33_78]